MSLINQMLKDLEARSAPQLDEHDETIKGVAWAPTVKAVNKRRYLLATLIASILCTGLAAGSYYRYNSANSSLTEKPMQTVEPVAMNTKVEAGIQAEARGDDSKISTTTKILDTSIQPHSGRTKLDREDSEARKMLAALVARGALGKEHVEKNILAPVPEQVNMSSQKVQLAEIEGPQNSAADTMVQKKLRPLDNSKLAEIAYQQGYEALARGNQGEAEKKLLHSLELLSTHTKAREMLAVMYLQQQRITDSAILLQQGMKLAPQHLAFREIYARTLMAQQQIPQAIAMLNKNAPDLNSQPNYHALLAGLYQQNKEFEQAATIYLKLVKKNPQNSHWWLGLAIAMEKMGKNTEALSAYKKAQELKLPARLMNYVASRIQELDASHDSNQ